MAKDNSPTGATPIALPAEEAREFLTNGEISCRLIRAPEVASLTFNNAAPDASLLALALARVDGVIGISDLIIELEIPPHVGAALYAARDAVQEVGMILNELQRRDGLQYRGCQQ